MIIVIMRLLTYIFVFFILSAAYQEAGAKVYKCDDSNGRVVYSNSPCPEDQQSEVIINTDRPNAEYEDGYYYDNESYQHLNEVENIEEISSGERVNINRHVAKNKITAFLFYADWCHACEQVKPQLEDIARSSDNFVLKKIDITGFESSVTDQYGIKSIPYFFVYDESGDLAVKGSTKTIFNYLNGKI